jgi:hypothetical protein
VVSGTNHHVVFEATAPGGTIYTHTATVFIALNGATKTTRHERTQTYPWWLSTGAIAGFACAAIGAVAGMIALARKRKGLSDAASTGIPSLSSDGQPMENNPGVVAADATNAL